jgi:hypothetical protein
MKKKIFAVVGISAMIFASSCKKTDVSQDLASSNQTASAAAAAQTWTSLSSWTSAKQEKYTSNSATIQNANITDAVVKNGLVLVFKKSGSEIKSLPFQDKAANASWYYQIANGSITINSDNYGAAQNLNSQSFAYFIVTAEKLADLQAKGKSEIDLLALSYQDAAAILK